MNVIGKKEAKEKIYPTLNHSRNGSKEHLNGNDQKLEF
jgi:hypothetical protein